MALTSRSIDEKEEEEEEEAVEPEDKGIVLPISNRVQPSPRLPLTERPQSAAPNINKIQQGQDKPAYVSLCFIVSQCLLADLCLNHRALKSVNHLLSSSPCADDIGLSASSRAILANRTSPAMKPTVAHAKLQSTLRTASIDCTEI